MTQSNEERQAFARSAFEKAPTRYPESGRADILAGLIRLGMSPDEAMLAGGAFSYKVQADPARWSADSDPYAVMHAQSDAPDDSRIWMIFTNATQSTTGESWKFCVAFERGTAVSIELLPE